MIQKAIRASGLLPGSVNVDWDPNAVTLNRSVKIEAVLFDCRGLLDTACWTVRCMVAAESSRACCCGALAREVEANGTYGSLRTAAAAALAELVRMRVLAGVPDSSQTIKKERPPMPAVSGSDFITDCVHS